MTSTLASRPTLADLFVTNLRLLDLHNRADWPNLTSNIYSVKDLLGQNQKTRIRCTEWALYRLFELWDAEETHNKLQPFFPVLEPLQSINLRAAIFRWLSDLKKNGQLGRETIVRKTMLDECKGEKFLEILVTFSTAVVRKIVLAPTSFNSVRQSLALRYAQNATLGTSECASLEPLTLVYRASLSSCLHEKSNMRTKCQNFANMLNQKSEQLMQRAAQCSTLAATDLLSEDAMSGMEKHIKDNWPGNSRWPRALLYGDDVKQGDQPLKQTFSRVWDSVIHGEPLRSDQDGAGLKQNLEQRVMQQRTRLQRWRSFHAEMSQNCLAGSKKRPLESVTHPNGFDFSRHQALHLSKRPNVVQAEPHPRVVVNRRLEAILEDLRQELDAAAHPAPRALDSIPKTVPEVVHHTRTQTASSSISVDLSRPTNTAHSRALSGNLGLARSSTAVPLSRVFSPAKKFRIAARSISTTSNDSNTSSSTANAAITERPIVRERAEPTPPPTPKNVQQEYDCPQEEDSVSNMSDAAAAEAESISSQPDDNEAENIISSVLDTFSPSAGTNMSLAERTQQSMSQLNNAASGNSHLRPFLARTSHQQDAHPATAVIAHGMVAERRTSLLERTQQSMKALNADAQSRSRKSLSVRKNRNSIAAFPVNQFETPGRPRPEPMRHATPTEKLFSAEAEYTSVFRSRPRVALSPQPSPNDEVDGLPSVTHSTAGNIIYEESEESSIIDDVDGDSWVRSSPLRGRG